jgi:hypothetical protein
MTGLIASISYVPLTGPGFWQPTPNPNPPDPPAGGVGLASAFVPGWGNVTPFTLETGEQFRPNGPPALSSRRYARDYDEVKSFGEKLSNARTADQSEIARFWYEGSQAGWNRIARVVAQPRGLDLWDQARLFTILNFAMADGFIAGTALANCVRPPNVYQRFRAAARTGITSPRAGLPSARGQTRFQGGGRCDALPRAFLLHFEHSSLPSGLPAHCVGSRACQRGRTSEVLAGSQAIGVAPAV